MTNKDAINSALEPYFSHTFQVLGRALSPDLSEFNTLGTLVLIGGAEDHVGETKVLRATWEINQAPRVVICPSASRIGDEVGRDYRYVFTRIGARQVDIVDPTSSAEFDQPRHIEAIQQADLIFFSGGDQVKLVHMMRGTKFLEAVRERYLAGATIAGTSAGASAAASPMIFDGNRKGFNKGAVHYDEGFALVNNLIVDTHFLRRRRIARMAQAIASGVCPMGLGLDEDTGIVLRGNGDFTVIGSSMVTVMGGKRMKRNTFHQVADDELITVTGLRIGFLPPGATFNIGSWTAL